MRYVLIIVFVLIFSGLFAVGNFMFERQECFNYMTYENFFQMESKTNGLSADFNFEVVHPIAEARAKACLKLENHYSFFFSDPILLNRNN